MASWAQAVRSRPASADTRPAASSSNNPLARPSHGTTRAPYVQQNFFGQMVPMGPEGAKSTENFCCAPDGGGFLWP